MTAAFAALWMVLAAGRAEVTYHLAPLMVATIPPSAAGLEGASSRSVLAHLAVFGGLLALAVSLFLSAAGRLSGPSLLPWGGAVAEAGIFSALGAAGAWLAVRLLRL